MAAKTVGELIKEARTGAKLSQAALAEAAGVSAADIGKAERGEKELSQAALKAIAKATGVTQKSLLDAAKGGTPAKKTTTTAKKTRAKKTAAAPAEELTAAEKSMLNAYRKADAETRKAALKLLRGEKDENILSELLQGLLEGNGAGSGLSGGLLDLLGSFGKK